MHIIVDAEAGSRGVDHVHPRIDGARRKRLRLDPAPDELQLGLGFGPMPAALYLAAMAVGAFVGSGVGAWAATAVGRPILHVGLAIMAVGTTVLYVSLRGAGSSGGGVGWLELVPGMVV